MKKIFTFIAIALAMTACNRTNPFLTEWDTPYGIPPFDQIRTSDYIPALKAGIEQQNAEIEAIVSNPDAPTFENTIVALENSEKALARALDTFYPLESSNSSQEYRDLDTELSPLLSSINDDIVMNPQLFKRVKAVYEGLASSGLDKEQKKLVKNIYKNFVQSGANLTAADQEKLRKLNTEISMLQLQFSQNLLHETNNTFVTVDKLSDLEGLSQADIDRAAAMAEEHGQKGKWMFNMQRTSCNPVLQYCKNRELRKKVYLAY